MQLTKQFINENLFRSDGKLNNRRLVGFTAEEVFLVYYEIEKPECRCGKLLKFINFTRGYQKFCSKSCSSKFNKAYLNGVNKILNMTKDEKEIMRDKIKSTCDEKYGGIGFSSKELLEKQQKTCEEKYGSKFYNNPNKISETIINRSLEEKITHLNKVKNTLLERYGVENISQSKEHRKLMENKLNWVPLEEMDDFKLYYRQVSYNTRKQNVKILDNYEKRGKKWY
jgi:hypothetical protein